jgi:plastocyanin domain-containing protein
MKSTLISIILAIVIIGSIILLTRSNSNNVSQNINNVSVVNGQQIIEINVRGGYTPRNSIAQAGLPTIIRFKTNGVFDCSASVRIPSIGFAKLLPQTGDTDVYIGTSTKGILNGACSMGMYRFDIRFID